MSDYKMIYLNKETPANFRAILKVLAEEMSMSESEVAIYAVMKLAHDNAGITNKLDDLIGDEE